MALAAVVAAAYANGIDAPFVFDDVPNIAENVNIRSLSPIGDVLFPPLLNIGIAGRPVLNLSFALNHAILGEAPAGFRAANVAIHILAVLLVYGIVRRTLRSKALVVRFGKSADVLAFAVALLWGVHPVSTEAVTYISGRSESLSGLLYLATVYFAIRGFDGGRARTWHSLATAAFVLGVGCKETVVTAPVVVLMWDVVFRETRPASSLANCRLLYAGFAAGWAAAAMLTFSGRTLDGIRGGLSPLCPYLMTQAEVVLHYLVVTVWPASLCVDYWWPLARPAAVIPQAVVAGGLVAATIVALHRRRPGAFLGVWFFGILSVTSLVPLPVIAADYRIYLPSVAVVTGVVIGAWVVGRRYADTRSDTDPGIRREVSVIGWTALAAASLILISLTIQRNSVFRDPAVLWADTAEKRPENPRALNNLANALGDRIGLDEQIALFRRAVTADPDFDVAHRNLGLLLWDRGEIEASLHHQREAIRLNRNDAGWRNDLAIRLKRLGRLDEAIELYREAIQIHPDWPQTSAIHLNLGVAYEASGRREEAAAEYRRALELDPGHTPAQERLDALEASELDPGSKTSAPE
jgi:hypothetical protein